MIEDKNCRWSVWLFASEMVPATSEPSWAGPPGGTWLCRARHRGRPLQPDGSLSCQHVAAALSRPTFPRHLPLSHLADSSQASGGASHSQHRPSWSGSNVGWRRKVTPMLGSRALRSRSRSSHDPSASCSLLCSEHSQGCWNNPLPAPGHHPHSKQRKCYSWDGKETPSPSRVSNTGPPLLNHSQGLP